MRSYKVKIIAEAGINHNGSLKKALKMVDVAKQSGVDSVKFQIFNAEEVVTPLGKMANYAKKNMKSNKKQLDIIKKYELSKSEHLRIKNYCKKRRIEYLCSAFDNSSLRFLKSIKLNIFKVPSGEITNFPYLNLLGSFKKKIILSTGMSTINEIKKAISVLTNSGTKRGNISLLHCNTDYPTNPKDLNLLAIETLKKIFKCQVGLSDHSLGIEASIAAVALGSKIIEKHFTLSRKMKGPDHIASLEPKELSELVKGIRNIEFALGKNKKFATKSEKKNIKIVRKSIVAKKKILRGEKFTAKNITTKRPGDGISAILWPKVIGKKSKKIYLANEKIKL